MLTLWFATGVLAKVSGTPPPPAVNPNKTGGFLANVSKLMGR